METSLAPSSGVTQKPRDLSHLRPSDPVGTYDLVCVGFGPASLAIAVALNDALANGTLSRPPRVLFLEKQTAFAWHSGMLLSGAKMQISYIKDLATLRNPRSKFTFVNYLHEKGRLVEFTNLGTFLPARSEYEDYMRWCASHFNDVVRYGNEVVSVTGGQTANQRLKSFEVISRDVRTGQAVRHRARNVILAVGGQPSIPRSLPAGHRNVIHSSQYAHMIPRLLPDRNKPYRVAVVGAGQSAAEIFNSVQTLYPNSRTSMVMRSEFMKPSDDSPFVNSIFNPSYVDSLFPRSSASRHNIITDAKATNYGVVRLELIEHLYERMYEQHRQLGADESRWPHRILGGYCVDRTEEVADGLRLHLRPSESDDDDAGMNSSGWKTETLDVDVVVAATGYCRTTHLDMLKDLYPLLPQQGKSAGAPATDYWEVNDQTGSQRVLEVGRDYRVQFSPGSINPGAGVFLQGCCERTHGLSDTLLSVLATRSGEIVESVFGGQRDLEGDAVEGISAKL